jgi:hypothetical protein
MDKIRMNCCKCTEPKCYDNIECSVTKYYSVLMKIRKQPFFGLINRQQ